jgi:hypothetical protein
MLLAPGKITRVTRSGVGVLLILGPLKHRESIFDTSDEIAPDCDFDEHRSGRRQFELGPTFAQHLARRRVAEPILHIEA